MKRIKIKLAGGTIEVTLNGKGSGDIATTGLHAEPTSDGQAPGNGAPDDDHTEYNSAIDGLEALILAHACAGIDIQNMSYVEGIESALEAIANNT